VSGIKEKLWTKDFLTVSVINFFVILIFYLLMVTTASFVVSEYHASASQGGLATGIYIVGTLIGRLFTGRVINSAGTKKVLVIGLIAFIITTGLYVVYAGIWLFLIIRLVNGMAAGIASTATGTMVAQIVPISRKSEGIGYFSMSSTLGTAIGPFLGITLSQNTSYTKIFLFCLALAVVAFIISFILKAPAVPTSKAHTVTEKPKQAFSFKHYIEPNAISIAIVTFLMSFGYAAILSFINFFAQERDLVTASSFFFLVYAIAILLTRPFSGRLMDTRGSNYVMVPCFILFAGGLVLISGAYSGSILLVAAAIIGAGFGNLQSGAQAIAVRVTPAERTGLATSTFFIALDAGLGFGPSLLGIVEPIIGYSSLFGGLAILALLSLVIYMLLHGRRDKQLIARAN